jgi:hypothetical protein
MPFSNPFISFCTNKSEYTEFKLQKNIVCENTAVINIHTVVTKKEYHLIGCKAAEFRESPMFQKNISPSSLGLRGKLGKKKKIQTLSSRLTYYSAPSKKVTCCSETFGSLQAM